MTDSSMNKIEIFDISFPSPSERVFDKMLWTDWYDGITGALVAQTRLAMAFKIDLLAWGPSQWQRIFAVSPFDIHNFDRALQLLAPAAAPTWPKWHPAWPSGTPGNESLSAEIRAIVDTAGRPTHVLASNADFNTIDQIKKLDEAALALLPPRFAGVPFRDNFDHWRKYLAVEKQKLPWAC
jgi:hypothetical protein